MSLVTPHTDIRADGWTARLPSAWRPYARLARLDRPIGVWLLLFPGWWSLALAGSKHLWFYIAFGVGAIVMRAAGCVVNDLADRKIDAQVERTRLRPIPAGEVTPKQALLFLLALLLIGLAILLSFNGFAILLGAGSLIFVAAYPFMKRITWWPQAFLGLTFNWGALLGWAAETGGLEGPAVMLYAAGVCWTIGYDTIYALQDREDDARVGVKSTARLFGRQVMRWVTGFYGAAGFLALAAFGGVKSGWGVAALVLAGAYVAWRLRRLRPNDPADCLRFFRREIWTGWLLLAGLTAGML